MDGDHPGWRSPWRPRRPDLGAASATDRCDVRGVVRWLDGQPSRRSTQPSTAAGRQAGAARTTSTAPAGAAPRQAGGCSSARLAGLPRVQRSRRPIIPRRASTMRCDSATSPPGSKEGGEGSGRGCSPRPRFFPQPAFQNFLLKPKAFRHHPTPFLPLPHKTPSKQMPNFLV